MKLATIGPALVATLAMLAIPPVAPAAPEAPAQPTGVIEPTLDSIQTNVFTPSCAASFCHGESMSANLDLREGNSYANIVDVPSFEFPVWDRIDPFFPDTSYLICKIEACPSMVGQQMPVIGGPLPQTVIDVIRAWVEAGAPETGTISVEPTTWGQVKAIYR